MTAENKDNNTGSAVVTDVPVASEAPSYSFGDAEFQILDDTPINPVDTYELPHVEGYAKPGDKIDDDILEMVKKLSLKEKIGQMTQIEIGKLMDKDGFLDLKQVEYWVNEWKVGSFIDSPGNHGGKYQVYSPQRFTEVVESIQKVALENGPKIPMIYGIDSVHGANYINGATLFPQPTSTAATFNPSHAYEAGRIAAKDTRAVGIPWIFCPCMDLNTEKIWSRNYENYGEDPYLASRMSVASVQGLQGNYKKDRNRVAACMKHWIGYGRPNNGKDRGSTWIPDNYLLEYFVPPFQAASDAGVASAMESFSDINGQPVPTSEFYVESLLRQHVGFKGLIVTDWGDLWRLYQDHQTAKEPYDATWQSIKNTSLDISMVPDNEKFSEALLHLVESDRISVERIDESVARVLQLKKDVGLFEQPYADKSLHSTVGSKQDVQLAIAAARESVTLLKNQDSALPLKKEDKIVVVGPTGNNISYQNGGWSLRWQGSLGNDEYYGGRGITIVDGIEKVTGTRPQHVRGPDIDGKWSQEDRDEVVEAVQDADKVIVTLGENTYAEFGGNVDDLTLPEGQLELVRLIKEASKAQIITVLVQIRPRLLKDIPSLSSAVVNAYLPGSWGGLAIAEILYGEVNPSGRLPFTYPKHGSQSSVTYWQGIYNYFNINGGEESYYNPEYPFGYGFGYSKITYSDIELSSSTLDLEGSPLEVSVKVKNEGPQAAKEPVLLYVNQHTRPGYTPDAYRLRAFDKIDLEVGEEKTVKFELSTKDVEYFKRDLKQHADAGVTFTVTVNAFQENARKVQFVTAGTYAFTR
ncbi:hypothetical protein INT43_005271 [Umbelopsis isabellina]|uniref:beta-glucosidase n=1 Tax=Mortierella isabellina TaxID=91625 RepID=A0A8H7PIG2_MORIS|nr:hypothetical protein INT43_005271 [Umbelopsis isabellina]